MFLLGSSNASGDMEKWMMPLLLGDVRDLIHDSRNTEESRSCGVGDEEGTGGWEFEIRGRRCQRA